MKKHLIAICALLLAGSSLLHAEQVYYCATEAAGGIGKKGGKWVGSPFKEERYTFKFNEDYTVLKTGGDEFVCSKVYGGLLDEVQHAVICYRSYLGIHTHNGVFFMFDKKSLRFVKVFATPYGYLSDGPDTNAIGAGTCEKF